MLLLKGGHISTTCCCPSDPSIPPPPLLCLCHTGFLTVPQNSPCQALACLPLMPLPGFSGHESFFHPTLPEITDQPPPLTLPTCHFLTFFKVPEFSFPPSSLPPFLPVYGHFQPSTHICRVSHDSCASVLVQEGARLPSARPRHLELLSGGADVGASGVSLRIVYVYSNKHTYRAVFPPTVLSKKVIVEYCMFLLHLDFLTLYISKIISHQLK